jgi:hypothetical protein
MAKPKNLKKQLEKQIPSRAQLGMESMFAPTQEQRDAAQHLLNLLPKKERSRDEEVQWMTEILTMPVPSESDMAKSPVGRATLAMLKNSKPMSGEIPAEAMAELEKLKSELATAAPTPSDPGAPADSPNEFVEQLAGWPPKSQQTPRLKTEEPRDNLWPRYGAGRQSEPSKDKRPISDWESDDPPTLY